MVGIACAQMVLMVVGQYVWLWARLLASCSPRCLPVCPGFVLLFRVGDTCLVCGVCKQTTVKTFAIGYGLGAVIPSDSLLIDAVTCIRMATLFGVAFQTHDCSDLRSFYLCEDFSMKEFSMKKVTLEQNNRISYW